MSKYTFKRKNEGSVLSVMKDDVEVATVDAAVAFIEMLENIKDKEDVLNFTRYSTSVRNLFHDKLVAKAIEQIGNSEPIEFDCTKLSDALIGFFIDYYYKPKEGEVYQPNEYFKFIYNTDKRLWQMHCIKDTQVHYKTLTAGTAGGWVYKPKLIIGNNVWVDDGAVVYGNSILKNCIIEGAQTCVSDSVILNSIIADDATIATSFVTDSNVREYSDVQHSHLINCSVSTTNLSSMFCKQDIIANQYLKHNTTMYKFIQAPNNGLCTHLVHGVGTRSDTLTVGFDTTQEVVVTTGCFSGSLKEFKKAAMSDKGRDVVESKYYCQMARYFVRKLEKEHHPVALKEMVELSNELDVLVGILDPARANMLLELPFMHKWVLEKLMPTINELEKKLSDSNS